MVIGRWESGGEERIKYLSIWMVESECGVKGEGGVGYKTLHT